MRKWMVEKLNKAGINGDVCQDKIVPYDPLCANDSHKAELKSLLVAAKPIERGQRFCATLNAEDEKMLLQIFEECKSSIKMHMRDGKEEGKEPVLTGNAVDSNEGKKKKGETKEKSSTGRIWPLSLTKSGAGAVHIPVEQRGGTSSLLRASAPTTRRRRRPNSAQDN